ncbi:hypothetical protein BGZ98_001034 [Dissophora globulifera]|nr:hypothetical protein BGZ98_001034 [Dissophora globulifera]
MTAITLTLFCVLSGDLMLSAFPVKISSDESIGQLKKAIITENPSTFEHIDAKDLVLWKITIPITLANQNRPIHVTDFVSTTDEDPLQPTDDLSDVFEGTLPKKTIHIVVEQPKDDVNPEVVLLQKQLSDMEQLNVGLRSTAISLGIIEKRGGKKVVCIYATDIKQATLQQLRTLLHGYFEWFDGDDHVQIFAYNPGSSKSTWLADDMVLHSCLEQAKEKDWKNLTISLDSPAKSFSTYTWSEMMGTYRVGGGPEFLPLFDIQPRTMTTDEKISLEEVVKECSRRNEAYIFGPSSSEPTRNTIVDAFMVGAMQSYKTDMFLTQQQPMSGRRGHGPVDFAVMDRIHQTQVLGVTEVKKDDHVQGLAQNMVRLDVAVQQKKWKRVARVDEDSAEPPATRLKSYDIVTNAFKWRFVECTLEEDDMLTFKAKEVMENFRIKHKLKVLKEDSETLFGYVLVLYDLMKDQIVNRSAYGSPTVRSPSNKRVAFGSFCTED